MCQNSVLGRNTTMIKKGKSHPFNTELEVWGWAGVQESARKGKSLVHAGGIGEEWQKMRLERETEARSQKAFQATTRSRNSIPRVMKVPEGSETNSSCLTNSS